MTKGYPHVHAKVLMVGPDLSLHGGIVSVVKGYLDAGLPEACDAFEYLGTGIGSSKLGKSVAFSRALIRYAMIMPSYDIIHLHISARGSYKRKSIMARMAHKAGKYVILHDHDGEFKKAFEEGGDSYRRDVRKTFSIADRVVVLSEEWRDYFSKNVCDLEKIDVVHNGVNVPDQPCSPCSRQEKSCRVFPAPRSYSAETERSKRTNLLRQSSILPTAASSTAGSRAQNAKSSLSVPRCIASPPKTRGSP